MGTAAFEQPLLDDIVSAVGHERVIIALDSKEGQVVVKGWRESVGVSAEGVVRALEPYCSRFLLHLRGQRRHAARHGIGLVSASAPRQAHELTAAGGITTLNQIQALQELGIHAALGMAILHRASGPAYTCRDAEAGLKHAIGTGKHCRIATTLPAPSCALPI